MGRYMGFLEEIKEGLNACSDENYQIYLRKQTYNLLKFLEDNSLLSDTSKLSTATFNDDYELHSIDLIDEGYELYTMALWSGMIPLTAETPPDNIKILEKYLKKIRSRK